MNMENVENVENVEDVVKVKSVENQSKQGVLLFGLGEFGQALLQALSPDWHVSAVDSDETAVQKCRSRFPDGGIDYYNGAGDSRLTWKKIPLEEVRYIVSTIKDPEVGLEICRLARKKFCFKGTILVLAFRENLQEMFAPVKAIPIDPMRPGLQAILNKLNPNVNRGCDIGLGKGELMEVEIKAKSHLVGRKFKYLRPTRWHISALYRDEKLILPDGNSSLRIGDRVILVGDPAVLSNVTTILLKGLPQFPLQYGPDIVFPLHADFSANMDEAIYWLNSFKAPRIRFIPFKKKLTHSFPDKIKKEVKQFEMGGPIELFKELFMLSPPPGVTVVPMDKGWLRGSRVRRAFKKSRKPFLISRLSFPYEGVAISLNGPDPGQALEVGIQVAQQLGIGFRAFYVTLPREMRGIEESARLRLRREIVTDFEAIHEKTLQYDVLEGNPVREALKYLEPISNHLLVLVTAAGASLSPFKPNVPYLTAKQTALSTLIIPEVHTDE